MSMPWYFRTQPFQKAGAANWTAAKSLEIPGFCPAKFFQAAKPEDVKFVLKVLILFKGIWPPSLFTVSWYSKDPKYVFAWYFMMLHFIFLNVEEKKRSNPQGVTKNNEGSTVPECSRPCYCNPKTRFTSLAADLLFSWLTAIHLCLKKASSAAAVAITCNRSWEWLDNDQHGCKKSGRDFGWN